jgi:murein DD-endopeptidase MepM/ murein hydrolase activator NlpD
MSPDEFDFRRSVARIAFPFAESVTYRYGDDFLARRVGVPEQYNNVIGVRADGSLQRGHDGVDIYVALGTPVRAPFEGRVVDPGRSWRPWLEERYGISVAIRSTDPRSRGYTALLVHLEAAEVEVGDRVRRGQVVGRVGRTGNAEGTPIHLHFELRAPFRVIVEVGGVSRWTDTLDPYPSLRRADPKAP